MATTDTATPKFTLYINGAVDRTYSRRIDACAGARRAQADDPTRTVQITNPKGDTVLLQPGNGIQQVADVIATVLNPEPIPALCPNCADDDLPAGYTCGVCGRSGPANEQTPAVDHDEMVALARSEWAALKTWKAAGSTAPRPATPNLDTVNALHAAYGSATAARRATKGLTAPKPGGKPVTPITISDAHTGERLTNGGLAALVAEALAAANGPVTVQQIAKGLQRSAGAVRNALDRQVTAGAATLVADKPRTYEATR